jgi:hypothetical protein
MGVKLEHAIGDPRRDGRDARHVVRAGGDDDALRPDRPPARLDDQAVRRRRDAMHARADGDGGVDHVGVSLDPGSDRVTAHVPVRIVAVVGKLRQGGNPVGGHEGEPVPAVLPASAEAVSLVHDEVLLVGAPRRGCRSTRAGC